MCKISLCQLNRKLGSPRIRSVRFGEAVNKSLVSRRQSNSDSLSVWPIVCLAHSLSPVAIPTARSTELLQY
jgi:hypothetical protein